MKRKTFLSLLVTLLCAVILVGCTPNKAPESPSGNAPAPAPKPTDLSGKWKSESNKNAHMRAEITNDSIEIFWVNETEKTEALYWSGSYTAPTSEVKEYSWTSQANKEKTENAIFASKAESKDFTYKDGVISCQVTALGVTKTVEFKKE